MSDFPRLPLELQEEIFNLCKPNTVTVHVSEADYEITYISPPPSLLTVNKTSRNVALKWGFKKYPIWTTNDWQDMCICRETTTLELVITPSTSSSLNITWTELQTIFGEALQQVKHLYIVCGKQERLARLFMLPEAELVSVGESCAEKGLFGSEVVASDRAVRESLRPDILVTTSSSSVEVIREGTGVEMKEWRLVEEEISNGLGVEKGGFMTRKFERGGEEKVVLATSEELKSNKLGLREDIDFGEEEWLGGKPTNELTAANLETLTIEMEEQHGEHCIHHFL